MDCLPNESVCSVKKENNLGYYRVHTIWNNGGFTLNLASKDGGAWTGEMTSDNMKSTSKDLKMDEDKYYRECKEALTTDDGKENYSYSIENGSFTWKKLIDEDSGIKVRMGSVVVKPASFVDTIQNILESSLNCKKNLQQKLDVMKEGSEREQIRAEYLNSKLNELIEQKNLMEKDLYTKFLCLLNAKKRKIKELEKLLHKEKSEDIPKTEDFEKDNEKVDAYDMETEDEDEEIKSLEDVKQVCSLKDTSEHECSENESEVRPKCDIDTESVSKTLNEDGKPSKKLKKTFPSSKTDLLNFLYGPKLDE